MSFIANNTFRAFKNRNYTLFFCGQSISQIGTWMQRTAVSWVIYTMTHSAFMLGVTVFAQQFPSFLLSLYGGIISDRYSKYKILLVTQAASMVQAITLALLTLTGRYKVWEILVFSVILGVINAFDVPARQPMVHEMVNDKEDLPNALSLNSAMVNMARLLAPALSGIVLKQFGAGVCFGLNAFSFIAVITSLLLMKLPHKEIVPVKKRLQSELSEGFQYLKDTPSISMILLMLTFISLLVLPYNTLLPIFAKMVFKGDAATFGYISSFMGLGAVCGTFFLASVGKGSNLKKILLANTFLLGISLVLFSQIANFHLAMVVAVCCGFTTMCQTTGCITIVQVESAVNMRGRVMSFVAMGYFGMLPLGSLLIGYVSQKIGAPNAILCQGSLSAIIGILFFRLIRTNKPILPNANQLSGTETSTAAKSNKNSRAN